MIFRKIKAGALQLTLFIVVVIALLLASFLILTHTHQQLNTDTDFVIETIDNANEGIRYSFQQNLQLNDTISIDLDHQDFKTLKLQRDYWGIFEKVISKAQIKNHRFSKVALVGASQPQTDRLALYVQDNHKPLVIVGNTKIQGMAYLPERGVKSGNISGQSYYGTQLIYGATKTSHALPKLMPEIIQHLNEVSNTTTIEQTRFIDLNKDNTFENSFLKPYQIIYNQNDIVLSNKSIKGHIIIQSETSISVEATANLKDVILMAPKISIQDDVKGIFQALATETIEVGSNCNLEYPSALVINENATTHPQQQTTDVNPVAITVNNATTLKGVVLFLTNSTATTYGPQIIIEENSKIYGEVYCNNNMELKGTVYGTVFTSNFIAKQSGSIYQNHIYNGTILIDSLQQHYVGLTFKDSKKDILKWLY